MSKKIIGVYPMFNTGGICVHAIDDAEDKVLASVNKLINLRSYYKITGKHPGYRKFERREKGEPTDK